MEFTLIVLDQVVFLLPMEAKGAEHINWPKLIRTHPWNSESPQLPLEHRLSEQRQISELKSGCSQKNRKGEKNEMDREQTNSPNTGNVQQKLKDKVTWIWPQLLARKSDQTMYRLSCHCAGTWTWEKVLEEVKVVGKKSTKND